VRRQIADRLHGAAGAKEFLDLILGVASVLGVERGQVILVRAPRRIDRQHHVRLRFERAVAEAAESFEAGLLPGEIFDEDKVRLSGQAFGAADAIQGFGHARPEGGRIFAGREGNPVKSPREEIARHEQAFAPSGTGHPGGRGQGASQQAGRSVFASGAFFVP
jgi:hypothetical protein